MKIIGNKDFFAVEYQIVNEEEMLGHAKVWFGNNFFGTSYDLIYLHSYLLAGLSRIENSYELDIDERQPKEILFEQLTSRLEDIDDNDIHQYLITFGTFTDDFTIFSFSKGEDIYVIWKLTNKNSIFPDLVNVTDAVNFFMLPKKRYSEYLYNIRQEFNAF